MSKIRRPTVHHSQLPAARAGDPLAKEWDTYRREVAHMLAEGFEGKFALVKGEQVVAIHASWDAAREDGLRRFFPEAFLVQQICVEQPILRIRGYSLPCPH
jgi:hypothetical protein